MSLQFQGSPANPVAAARQLAFPLPAAVSPAFPSLPAFYLPSPPACQPTVTLQGI